MRQDAAAARVGTPQLVTLSWIYVAYVMCYLNRWVGPAGGPRHPALGPGGPRERRTQTFLEF